MIVAVIVIVLLVLSLVDLEVFPGGSSGVRPGSESSGLFSTARVVADLFAAGHGIWALVGAVGIAAANESSSPTNGTAGFPNCTVTYLTGSPPPTNLSLPAFQGNLTTGDAPVWLFTYIAPANGSELAIFEVSGVVTLAIESSSGCTLGGGSVFEGVSTNITDSSTAVLAAAAAGGANFLQAHSTGVSLTMLLTGPVTLLANITAGPLWVIQWSTCVPPALGSTYVPPSCNEFSAIVNATTGVVVPKSTTNTTGGNSGQGIQWGFSLEQGTLFRGSGTGGTIASQGCASGDYCYSFSIEGPTGNVTPAAFLMSVQNLSNLETYNGTVGFAALSPSGAVVVSSIGAIESRWTSGVGNSGTPLTAGMTFVVDMGALDPSTGAWALAFTGQPPYNGGTFEIGF